MTETQVRPGGARHDCRDAGGRATQDAVADGGRAWVMSQGQGETEGREGGLGQGESPSLTEYRQ
ncbi:MAG: hypothetical protein PVF28_03185, partial [Thioalkalispiraceae bacterium]